MFWKIGGRPSSDKIHRLLVKLTLIQSLSFFLFIVVVTLIIYFGFKHNLEQEDDEFLVQKYESVIRLLDLYGPRDAEFEKQVGSGKKESKAFFYIHVQDLSHHTVFTSSPDIERYFLAPGSMKLRRKEAAYEILKIETMDDRSHST